MRGAVVTRRRAAAALAVLVAAVARAPAPAAEAQEPAAAPCPSAGDYCVEAAEESGTGTGTPASRGGDGGARCTSEPLAGAVGDGIGIALPNDPGPRPAPESVLLYIECDGAGRVAWWTPGAPQPPSAAGLAGEARARLEGRLPAPSVVSSPAPGVAAIVGFPSFVAVENWPGAPVTDRACDAADPTFCVTVEARPSLTWLPGEPGAAPVACAGGGTRFDPAAGPPGAQAVAGGACAHTYRLRTGAAGRPGEWPGVVIVRWALAYGSPTGAGALPDVVKTAALPRAVDEAQTVVETAG